MKSVLEFSPDLLQAALSHASKACRCFFYKQPHASYTVAAFACEAVHWFACPKENNLICVDEVHVIRFL